MDDYVTNKLKENEVKSISISKCNSISVLQKNKNSTFSKEDVIFFKETKIKITNSVILFFNNYQSNNEYILYKKISNFHNKKVRKYIYKIGEDWRAK